MSEGQISATKALKWLIEGNNDYISSEKNHHGDISLNKRMHTHHHGQNPFAIIITCSDSRLIPESIFMKGIGDLFVIRVAGNVVGDFEIGSVEYAVEHLGCNLIMVMGHTRCGAIQASMEGSHNSFIGTITNEIRGCIGNTTNTLHATKLNVNNTIKKLESSEIIKECMEHGLEIVGSIYHTNTGHVEIMK